MTREEAITTLKEMHDSFDEIHENTNYEIGYEQMTATEMAIEALQEVQKHEKTFEWCHDCKEYDTDNHCCHRWSKVISNTVEELKTDRPQGEWIKHEIKDTFKAHLKDAEERTTEVYEYDDFQYAYFLGKAKAYDEMIRRLGGGTT